jgi:hypothetical protein
MYINELVSEIELSGGNGIFIHHIPSINTVKNMVTQDLPHSR